MWKEHTSRAGLFPQGKGRANVALLAARTGIGPKQLSPHLSKLKDLGLIFSQRQGKEMSNPPTAASATSGSPTKAP